MTDSGRTRGRGSRRHRNPLAVDAQAMTSNRTTLRPFAFAAVLAAAGCARADDGTPVGTVPRYALGEPEAVSGDFGSVNGIRARPDGSLLVADMTGMELVLLDADLTTRTEVGSRGAGPGEYETPTGIWPLPGDSTLLLDMGNNRLTVLAPDLSFGATRPVVEVDPETGIQLLVPRGIDGAGHIYVEELGFSFAANLGGGGAHGGPNPDSTPVVRKTLDGPTVDTVARLAPRSSSHVETRGGTISLQRAPYPSSDSWGVAPDGSVVVARAANYRLEWHFADGSVRIGAPVVWDPVPVGRAEKEAWVEGRSRSFTQTTMAFVNGSGGGALPGGVSSEGISLEVEDVDDSEWPEALPAFAGDILIDPEGRAWLRRHRPVGAPSLYDVFTPDAEHAGTVETAAGRTVVGFGDGVVYASFNDEFDLAYIERYRLPKM